MARLVFLAESISVCLSSGNIVRGSMISALMSTFSNSSAAAFEQTFGIVGGRGQHDLEAGDMTHPDMQALAVLGRGTASRSQGGTHHHRHLELAPRHIVNLGRLVKDLIHCQSEEVAKHDIHD